MEEFHGIRRGARRAHSDRRLRIDAAEGRRRREAILSAIRHGYRHIDTAAFYGNESEVGDAIKASGVKREDIFLTTKVRDNNLKADDFARSLDNSLKLLDLPRSTCC